MSLSILGRDPAALPPSPLPSGKGPFRWKLWLTVFSPVVMIGGFATFFLHARSSY
jgi:hypothetical protein